MLQVVPFKKLKKIALSCVYGQTNVWIVPGKSVRGGDDVPDPKILPCKDQKRPPLTKWHIKIA
jgi:hypothetical protein